LKKKIVTSSFSMDRKILCYPINIFYFPSTVLFHVPYPD
jgi:hypothetical protein